MNIFWKQTSFDWNPREVEVELDRHTHGDEKLKMMLGTQDIIRAKSVINQIATTFLKP